MAKKYNNRYCFGMRSEKCGYPFKVSKQFNMVTEADVDGIVTTTKITGSANDILKVIRDLRWAGYAPYDYYGTQNERTLRSKEKYVIEFDDVYLDYCVYHVNKI